MRLIDADALIAEYDNEHVGEPGKARMLMEKAPTIDAVPVVHGRWEWYRSPICLSGDLYYRCSICKEGDPWQHTTRGHATYCPKCGARMDDE